MESKPLGLDFPFRPVKVVMLEHVGVQTFRFGLAPPNSESERSRAAIRLKPAVGVDSNFMKVYNELGAERGD